MKYKILISTTAYNQITECVSFAANVSTDAAKQLYLDIMSSINSLEDMPERCPVVNELKTIFGATRKLLIDKGRYATLFRINGDTVFINYVIDLRSNKYLKELFK